MAKREVGAGPKDDNWVTVRRGHFSRLYFKNQEERRGLDNLGSPEKTDYEGRRYVVPEEALDDTISFEEIDKELKDAWENDENREEDIRLLREIQWKKEGSDYKYRYWLQCEVEKTSAGNRSLKILMSLNDELKQAEKKWEELAVEFSQELNKLINHLYSIKLKQQKPFVLPTLSPEHDDFQKLEINDRFYDPIKPLKVGKVVSSSQPTKKDKSEWVIQEISKTTIRVLFQTINKTQRTLADACNSLNKSELVGYLNQLDKKYDPINKNNRQLREKLEHILGRKENKEIKNKIHQLRYSFSDTPSSFLLKLYPQILDIVQPSRDYFNNRNFKGTKIENERKLEYKKKAWAIKISRYTHFLLCRMDWIRINIASPTEAGHYLSEDTDEKQVSLPTVHRLSPKLLGMVQNGDDAIVRQFQRDPKRTMYCYPKPHKKNISKVLGGGFHTQPEARANDGRFRKFKNAGSIPHERFEPAQSTLDALNHLQGTQWSVNLDLLQYIAEFTNEGKPISPRLDDIRYGAWAKSFGMQFQTWITGQKGMNLSELKDTPRVQTWNRILELTRKNMLNGGNVFWHAWWCDWRGRFNTRAPNLGPQGDDLSKALLLFTEWKPMGERGRYWLYVKMYDLFNGQPHLKGNESLSHQKKTFDEKEKWTKEHLSILLEKGAKPKHSESMEMIGLDTEPTQKSETFQRFATLLEFCRVHAEYDKYHDWDKVTSGLPIHLDASCNGFQHMAALLRDEKLAKKVNVLKGEKIGDLYQEVAEKAQQLLISDPKNMLAAFLIQDLGVKRTELELWTAIFTRSLCKKPVMIAAFGAKDLLKPLVNRSGKSKYFDVEKEKYIGKKLKDYIKKIKDQSFLDLGQQQKFVKLIEKYKTEESVKENLSSPEQKTWELLKTKFIQKGDGPIYTKAKRTLHADSLLYIELEKVSKNPPKMFEKIFFKEIEGVPDKIQNAVTCWTFAVKVAKHLEIAISKVTGGAHLRIEDQLKLMNHVTKKDGFRWCVSGEESSQIRRVSIESKKNHNPGLRAIHNYNPESKPPPAFTTIALLEKSVEELRKNSTVLSIDEKQFVNFQQHIEDLKKNTKKVQSKQMQSKQIRGFRSQLFRNLVKLYELKSNKSDAPDHLLMSANAPHLEKIQDLIVGFYTWITIDVPHSRDEDWETKNWGKTETGLAPNFIHSFDAKHMENVINSLNTQGIQDIWAVHDSFGVHACDVDRLVKTAKHEFVELHKNDFTKVVNDLCELNNIDENLEKHFKKTVRDDSQKYKVDLEEHKKLEKTTGKKSKATEKAQENLKASRKNLDFSKSQLKSYENLVPWRKKDWEATEAAEKQFEKEMENAEYLIS